MEFDTKDVKKIKEILTFLNKEFFEWDNGNSFIAYHPRGSEGNFQSWHVCCNNYLLYAGKDFNSTEFEDCKEAIKIKYPRLKIIFVYQHEVTFMVAKREMKRVIILK